jgi:hypothetical protein
LRAGGIVLVMSRLLVATAVVAAALAGCLIEPVGTLSDNSPPPPPPSPQPPEPVGAPDRPMDVDFPCDVRAVLETYCAGCHAGNFYIVAFSSRSVWLSAYGDAGGTFGDRAAQLVTAGMMPPVYSAGALPTAAERAILIDWVAAGMPAGPCAPLTPPERP